MSYEVCFDGWEGSADVAEMASNETEKLEERGAEVKQITLIMKSAEFFNGFYYLYDPGEMVKSYLVTYNYKGQYICVNIDGVNSHWQNPIRNGVNEALRRCDSIDAVNVKHYQGYDPKKIRKE